MLKKMILCSVFLLFGVVSAQAAELAISFSDQTAQLLLRHQVAEYQSGRSVLSVRGLYNDRKETELVSASFDVLGPLASTGLEIGAGVRGYYVTSGINHEQVGAGGIGVLVRFVPPRLTRASFTGSLYYCPEVFNILDSEGLWDAEVKASFEIAPRAVAFASYTEIEADIEFYRDRTLDKTFRVGLSLGF
ncbi:MAG: hypothetical protein KAS94_04600 [Desulfobulbaceae bacterium]|nr:hypothetical protein [Desulfobulbaceae bacterium]